MKTRVLLFCLIVSLAAWGKTENLADFKVSFNLPTGFKLVEGNPPNMRQYQAPNGSLRTIELLVLKTSMMTPEAVADEQQRFAERNRVTPLKFPKAVSAYRTSPRQADSDAPQIVILGPSYYYRFVFPGRDAAEKKAAAQDMESVLASIRLH